MDDAEMGRLLGAMTLPERQRLLTALRDEPYRLMLHPLEQQWNVPAEVILEAIHEAPDLIQRGVRGVLAEAIYRTKVVPTTLPDWISLPVHNDAAYDLMLRHKGLGSVRVQVKSQRKLMGVPMTFSTKATVPPVYVVETQRTRNGKLADGTDSRPYRFSEFDVLAVCMHASTGDWENFLYCAAPDLLARPTEPTWLAVKQPVYLNKPSIWSRNLAWLVHHNLRNRTDGRSRPA